MWSGTEFVLSHNSEDVLLLLDEFGHQVAASSERRGDSAPAKLQLRVVLLLQSVVEDLTSTVIKRRIPLTDHRAFPHLLKSEVDGRSRSVCRGMSGQHFHK